MSTEMQLTEARDELIVWDGVLERIFSGDLFDEATTKIAQLKETIKRLESKLKQARINFDSI